MREFTKGVFKFGFYLCVYFDPQFRFTSIVKIAEKIKQLVSSDIAEKLNWLYSGYAYRGLKIYRSNDKDKRALSLIFTQFINPITSFDLNSRLIG